MQWMQPACEEAARLMSQQHDEPLGRWQRLRLRWHLALCGNCREVDRQLDRLTALARGWLSGEVEAETEDEREERAQR